MNRNTLKRWIAPAIAAATLAGTAPAALAYPDKTITIVVPTSAGGANDAMARTIAQKLGPLLGQTVIIDNRAGANGAVADSAAATVGAIRRFLGLSPSVDFENT